MTRKFILIWVLAFVVSALGIVIFTQTNGIAQWIVISLVLVSSLCLYLLAEAKKSLNDLQRTADQQVTSLVRNLQVKRASIVRDLDEYTIRAGELIRSVKDELIILISIPAFPMITDLLRGTELYKNYVDALDGQLTRYLEGNGPAIRISCFPLDVHDLIRSVIENHEDKDLLPQYQKVTGDLLLKLGKCQKQARESRYEDFEFHTITEFSNLRMILAGRKRAIVGMCPDYPRGNRESHRNLQLIGFEVESIDAVASLDTQWKTFQHNDVTIDDEFINNFIGGPVAKKL